MYEIKDGLDNIAEYSVKKRREGEYEQRRRLAIVLMAAFAVASAVVCILLFGIMFPAWLIPLWILFYSIVIPLIYLPNFNIEYDYRVAGGELNIAAVKNRRTRKELASIRLAGAEFIAPYNGSFKETADRAECDGVIDASSSESSPDRWFAIYPDPDGGQKRYLIFFDASPKMVSLMRPFAMRGQRY
ncbi:MAG: hypothetical protein KIG76_03110 [Eubacteriales bacterium]|nr:hypothetical protein [Candidatus Colimorpha enterica]